MLGIIRGVASVLSVHAFLGGSSLPCRSKWSPTISDVGIARQVPERSSLTLDSGATLGIISRTLQVTNDWEITIWELEKPSELVEKYWDAHCQTTSSSSLLDPFGLVCWPGALVAAQEMLRRKEIVQQSDRVLVVGAGTGIECQAAAMLGCQTVCATDIHPTTLKLLEHGAKQAGLDDVIVTRVFDLFSDDPLPPSDLMIVADVLYNEALAKQVAKRCLEARRQESPPIILVSDSQRFVDFPACLNALLEPIEHEKVSWEFRPLDGFTGSGVLVDEDQTYDVKARLCWVGI